MRKTEDVRPFQVSSLNTREYVIRTMVFCLVLLTGCATRPATLYYWGDYQGQVYEYLKAPEGGDIAKQIVSLEAGVQKAAASNQALPPGYRAQLGMLYYAQGNLDRAEEQLSMEKTAYPESAIFMDRLLAKFRKSREGS